VKLLLATLFLSLAVFILGLYLLRPVSPTPAKISFVITKDESATSVIRKLKAQKLIRSSLVAKIYLRLSAWEKFIQPGGYVLSPSLSTPELLRQLKVGPKDIWVTLPEGWRREQIAARMAESLSGPNSNFDSEKFMTLTASLEGQLFPDTYLISQTISAPEAISILTSNFTRKSGLDLAQKYSLLIVASLVEREANQDQDRPLIAGILLKRLEAGWPLQVDASVQYASDTIRCRNQLLTCDWWQPVADTRIPSVYNTYLSPGLPPSPIANPGLAAITAVLTPQISPYWYYLTDPDGVTHYAESLSEHNSNIDKYLRL